MIGSALAAPPLIVPAYFHPDVRPGDWSALMAHAGQVRMVVLNVASGPGERPNVAFAAVVDALRAAGICVAGYVDTDYGARPVRDVLADVIRHRDWYGDDAVFCDRVASSTDRLGHYAALAGEARDLGMSTIAFNHGADPAPAYLEYADLLGAFEGPWPAYVELMIPRWAREQDTGRLFHLVHSVPPELISTAWDLAAQRNLGCVYITTESGINPWHRLSIGTERSTW